MVGTESVEVGATLVARLDDGAVAETDRRAMVRQLNVAGSANRPIAIFTAASATSGTVIDVINVAQNSGASVVGLVARLDGDKLGWIPIQATPAKDAKPMIHVGAGQQDFGELADANWENIKGTHRLAVNIDGALPAQQLFELVHELRGPRCAEEPGFCRFAALNLSTVFGGRDGAGDRRPVPRVRQSNATVRGGLDKDIVRRIVRSHINEVRSCYSKALATDPTLEGRVAVKFRVGPSGRVEDAKVESTTLPEGTVAPCVAAAVQTWKFPKPIGGGFVNVTYPFVFAPG